jgi:hypothetical protein
MLIYTIKASVHFEIVLMICFVLSSPELMIKHLFSNRQTTSSTRTVLFHVPPEQAVQNQKGCPSTSYGTPTTCGHALKEHTKP